ncbi:permeases of the major facilitator superfamily [Stylonychia lemnae]|uniref:Permeases of the major facilitator superfamily n=1 Tax=Stylonychia lemnae TaxID=5949 RepID=A0A078AV01_STYLE|nr:permeases of the major facilitator superfamily [Stylonychia lemnae]|eukprot:CDW85082.1 permeases of the major facilitator superfamily [Stylonychia lemnae]
MGISVPFFYPLKQKIILQLLTSSILLRFYQGFADAHILVASFAIASAEFKKNRGVVIGYMEAGVGFGFMMGAPIGQTLQNLMSYQFIFFGFGAFQFFPAMFAAILLPERMNKSIDDQIDNLEAKDIKDVCYGNILKNKKVQNFIFFTIIGMVVMLFNQMLITRQLVKLGIPRKFTGNYTFLMNIRLCNGYKWASIFYFLHHLWNFG